MSYQFLVFWLIWKLIWTRNSGGKHHKLYFMCFRSSTQVWKRKIFSMSPIITFPHSSYISVVSRFLVHIWGRMLRDSKCVRHTHFSSKELRGEVDLKLHLCPYTYLAYFHLKKGQRQKKMLNFIFQNGGTGFYTFIVTKPFRKQNVLFFDNSNHSNCQICNYPLLLGISNFHWYLHWVH